MIYLYLVTYLLCVNAGIPANFPKGRIFVMKKTISLVLGLVLIFSVFAFSVNAATLDAESTFNVTQSDVSNNKVTYTINLASNVSISDFLIWVKYDTNDLKVVEGGACTKIVDGDEEQIVPGYIESDILADSLYKSSDLYEKGKQVYAFGYMYTNYNTGSTGKKFAYVTFEIINPDRSKKTNVQFYFGNSIDGDKQNFASVSTVMLNKPKIKSVADSSGYAKVSWDYVKGADTYVLQRKVSGGSWATVKTGSMSADKTSYSYTDKELKTSGAYYYRMYVKAGDLKSAYSATSSKFTFVEAPTVKATYTSGGIKVTWNAVSSASKYAVYRREAGSSSWKKIVSSTTSRSYTAKELTAGKTYEFSVKAIDSSKNTSPMAAVASYRYLKVPSVKTANSATGVKVSWGKVTGASSYKVCRRLSGESKWTGLDTVKTTSFVDATAKSGKTYEYLVYAIYGSSRSVSSSVSSIKYLAAPKISSIETVSNGIKMKWSKVSGAGGYYIMRKTTSGSFSKIATTTSTSYTDKTAKTGTKYVYTIKAYKGKDVSGYNTTGWKATRLSAPSVKIANAESGVKVTWGKVKNADSYKVYRKTAGSSSFKCIATVTSGTSYTDTKAKSGTKYVYTVKGCYGDCCGLGKSSSELKYLASPKISSLETVKSGITVKWGKVTGAEGYYVYRKTGSGSFEKIATTKSTSYTDKKATAGTKYKYMLKAYSGKTVSGFNSSGWSAARINAPKVTVKIAENGISVSWKAVSPASKYIVYRMASGETEWSKIATVSSTSYVDKNVENANTYKYSVKVVYGSCNGIQSAASEMVYLLSPEMSVVTGIYELKVTWLGVEGATSYNVYRKTADTDWALIASPESTEYADTQITAGTEYIYTVTAVNGNAESFRNEKGVVASYEN